VDTLRNLFGNVTSTILRLVLVVGTMAAVYFFAIKPVLDTTEKSINSFSEPLNRSVDLSTRQLNRALVEARQDDRNRVKVPGATRVSLARATKLLNCIQRANGDVQRINRCQRRFMQ
jgi:hypothetical protein